jgi:hypothetical protein
MGNGCNHITAARCRYGDKCLVSVTSQEVTGYFASLAPKIYPIVALTPGLYEIDDGFATATPPPTYNEPS